MPAVGSRRGLAGSFVFLRKFIAVFLLLSFGSTLFLLANAPIPDPVLVKDIPRINPKEVKDSFPVKHQEPPSLGSSFHSCQDIFGTEQILQQDRCLRHKLLDWAACEIGDATNRIAIVPGLIHGSLGGEAIQEVLGRKEREEQLDFREGALVVPSPSSIPDRLMQTVNPHLQRFLNSAVVDMSMVAKRPDTIKTSKPSPTLIVRRGNYANPCMAILTLYNVYIVLQHYFNYFARPPDHYQYEGSELTILWLDGHALGGLDPVWEVLFGTQPIHIQQLATRSNSTSRMEFSNPMVVNTMSAIGDEGIGLYSWIQDENASSVVGGCPRNSTLVEFRDFVLKRYGLGHSTQPIPKRVKPMLTLLVRKDYMSHPRSTGYTDRTLSNVSAAIDHLKSEYPSHDIQAVSFEELPFRQQLQIMISTDIFVAVHGAGNVHVLFLPPDATFVEYVPKNFQRRRRFRYLAECLNINYVSRKAMDEKRRIRFKSADNNHALQELIRVRI